MAETTTTTLESFSWNYQTAHLGQIVYQEEFDEVWPGVTPKTWLVGAVFLVDQFYDDPEYMGPVLPIYFGDDPETGEKIIVDVSLTWEEDTVYVSTSTSGSWIPIDPGAPTGESDLRVVSMTVSEFMERIEPDRVYPVLILGYLFSSLDELPCQENTVSEVECTPLIREGVRTGLVMSAVIDSLQGRTHWTPTEGPVIPQRFYMTSRMVDGNLVED